MDKAEREKLRSFAQAAIDSTEFGDYEWYTDDPMSVSGRDADYVAALKPQILIALLDHIDALEQKREVDVDKIMAQAQVFASSWSLVGGCFDNGSMMETAEHEKACLREMLIAAAPEPQ